MSDGRHGHGLQKRLMKWPQPARPKQGETCLFLACLIHLAVALAPVPAQAQAESSPSAPPSPSLAAPASAPAQAAPTPSVEPAQATETNTAPAGAQAEAPALDAPNGVIDPTNLPHDLSPWGMFIHADIVVQFVMAGLVFGSLATWTIGLAKMLELLAGTRNLRRALDILSGAQGLRQAEAALESKLGRGKGVSAKLVRAAISEAERSQGLPAEGIKERAAALLSRIEIRASRAMTRGTGILATIGATGPFVGLFGTVWGIMNSFIGISKSNTTNLAVVAPGIAEALLATACGLVAAIPAVIIYNVFSRAIAGYKGLLGDASTEVLRHLSRDLDRAALKEQKEWHVTNLRQPAE